MSGGAVSRYGNRPTWSTTGTRCHAAQTSPRISTPQRRPHAAIAKASPPPAQPSSSSTLVSADPPMEPMMASKAVPCDWKLTAPTAMATAREPKATRRVTTAAPSIHVHRMPDPRSHRRGDRARPATAGLKIIISLPRSTSCGSAVAIRLAGSASTMMTKRANLSRAKTTLKSPGFEVECQNWRPRTHVSNGRAITNRSTKWRPSTGASDIGPGRCFNPHTSWRHGVPAAACSVQGAIVARRSGLGQA